MRFLDGLWNKLVRIDKKQEYLRIPCLTIITISGILYMIQDDVEAID